MILNLINNYLIITLFSNDLLKRRVLFNSQYQIPNLKNFSLKIILK